MKRAICLHYHIFKNAGMTMGWILEKNFDVNHIRMDVDKSDEILPMNAIVNFLEKHQDVKAFSSHLIKFPIPKNLDFEIVPILFVRHPIDRIFSIYHYNKSISVDDSPGSKRAKAMSLSEYIKWELVQKKRMNFKNFQTLFLSDKDIKLKVDDADLKVGIERLTTIPVLGVVDRFDESMVLAEELLKRYYPEIDFAYARQNVSSKKNLNLEEKIELGNKEIGEELMIELNNNNTLDLELYSKANKILDERILSIPDFKSKLEKFQNRCKEIQEKKMKSDTVFKHPRLWYSLEKNEWYYKKNTSILKKIFKK